MTTVRRLVCAAIGVVGLAVAATPAHAVPAFARKYGMKCTACHEAWPVLNQFGRAFRDNGFRFNTGRDNEVLTNPEYWPIFSWNWTGYQFNQTNSGSHVLDKTGGVAAGLWSIGAYVNLGEHISLRVFAPLAIGAGPNTISVPLEGWLRYNRLFNTDWLNVRVGGVEQDMPIAGARDLTENGVGGTLWGYAIPGSVSNYSMETEVQGFQFDGHDRGSINRYSLSFYSNEGPFSTHHDIWSTPGVFATVTHLFQNPFGTKSFVRDLELDLYGSYSTWGVGKDSTTLAKQWRYGATFHQWLFKDALPIHVLETWEGGRDDPLMFVNGVRPGVFNGGMIQVSWVPSLPIAVFSRASFIVMQQQAALNQIPGLGDENIFLLGFKWTYQITTRFEVAIEPSYGLTVGLHGAPDGTNLYTHQAYFPLEVVF
jgi:hypothetical protein